MNLGLDRITLGRVGVAVFLAGALAALAPAASAEEWTKTYTAGGRPSVRVQTDDGSVRVSSGDSKQIELRVEYQGFTLDKDLHIQSHQQGDRVELTARTRGHWCMFCMNLHQRLRIEVRMPRDADLELETGDGSVDVQSVYGAVSVRTGDGSVKAGSLRGKIDLHTNDGSITVDSLKGEIRLHTGDGHIEARDVDGNVDADTGDGHVMIAGRFDLLKIKTGDGSVDAKAASGSKVASSWSIRTGDGSVDLTLPTDLQANIDASTGDGRISMGIPVTVEGTFSKSQIQGKMNGGGPLVTIHTGDGSIRLGKS